MYRIPHPSPLSFKLLCFSRDVEEKGDKNQGNISWIDVHAGLEDRSRLILSLLSTRNRVGESYARVGLVKGIRIETRDKIDARFVSRRFLSFCFVFSLSSRFLDSASDNFTQLWITWIKMAIYDFLDACFFKEFYRSKSFFLCVCFFFFFFSFFCFVMLCRLLLLYEIDEKVNVKRNSKVGLINWKQRKRNFTGKNR